MYIHPEGSSLGGGALGRNMRALRSLLGSSYLDRLTILLIPRSSGELDLDQLTRPLLDPKSPFADLIAAGARCDVSKLETKSIGNILLRYTQRTPELVKLHREYTPGHKDLKRHVEGYLNQKDITAPPSRPTIKDSSQKQPASKPRTAQDDSSELKRLEREVADSKSRADDLHTQLQQSRIEYHSLRSQLQLNENIEQSQVLQDLVDLNRRIDDFGHSLSEHLIDKYAGPNRTSLHASQLSKLQGLFGHEEGKASLVQSATGVGMPLEDFFDLATRSILCEQLYRRIFALFHPCVAEPRNSYTLQLYSRVRDEGRVYASFIRSCIKCSTFLESQPAAGRWRTATFDALTRVVGHDQISQHKKHLAHDILNKNIMPLLKYFFDPNKNVELTSRHVESLAELVSHAWEWNMSLKGKIILLGDFNPTAYRYGCSFDDQAMSEFEPKHGGPTLTRILSTIGIGLSVSHAQGAGKAPERIILCKASVVSESRFEA